jgi:hypothetical protein
MGKGWWWRVSDHLRGRWEMMIAGYERRLGAKEVAETVLLPHEIFLGG